VTTKLTTNGSHHGGHAAIESLEARVGLRMAARLSLASEELPHDLNERLRVARERAVAVARQQQRLVQTVVNTAGGQATLGGPPWWWRLAAVLPLVVLVAGLVLIQRQQDAEQITVAADIDSALLVDALPPQAYTDPGFSAFLRMHNSP
jgi:hypothetical protein